MGGLHILTFFSTFAADFAQETLFFSSDAAMVESVDTRDLKSLDQKWLCGFKSHSRYCAGELLSGSFLFF